jgi:hypothetical protein
MLSKPEHPPLTIDALASWLRTQPPDQTYVWSDPVFCMMGQYLAAHDSSWGATQYSLMPGYEEIAAEKPWTFGAALERAEKLLALPAPITSEMSVMSEPHKEPLLTALPEIELEPVKALPAPATN